MVIRQGNRQQMQLLPASIEQYVAEDAPVRAYDAFIEALAKKLSQKQKQLMRKRLGSFHW